jgi:alkylation response protein AidB-like acyl-CoA dehydrogenase
MADYRVPREDMQFVLQEVFRVQDDWAQCAQLADLDMETAVAIIDESAKLAEGLIAPNARAADEQGVQFRDGVVTTPAGYKENFRQLADGGWVGVTANPEYGGMGLPKSISAQYEEILCAADISFSLYPGLTAGAIMTLDLHASDSLKALYLPKLISGEWTGTMCLTEPHAGTDLGIIRSKAIPAADGSFQISGTKGTPHPARIPAMARTATKTRKLRMPTPCHPARSLGRACAAGQRGSASGRSTWARNGC